MAEHLDLALVGDRLRGEDPHRRGLAGAVGAEQPDARAGGHVEVEARDRGDLAVALDHAAQPDGGSIGRHAARIAQPRRGPPARRRYAGSHVEPVHLHDAPPDEGLPARQDGARGHHARLLPGRQDRRARLQRRRQVDAAADHGRHRHRVPRRRAARARRDRRPARAGAAARRPAKDVRGNVEDGVAATQALLDRFNELAANYSDETADEFAALQAKIDAADAWNLDTDARLRDGRAAPARRPTPTSTSSPAASAAASRSAGCCSARPTCCCSTSRPTTSTPSRSLARAPPRRVQGHRRRRDPRSLLPRQRRRLDPRARPRRGHPVRGQLLELARAEAEAPRAGGEGREERASARSPPSSSGCARTPRAARPSRRRACSNYEALVAQERNVKLDEVQIHIPAGTAPRRRRRRGRGPAQGLRRQAADRGPLASRCRAAASSASSAPTAPARRRCSG